MSTVVIAMHYQNEVLHARGRIRVGVAEDAADRDGLIERAGRLLSQARYFGIPVVSVRIAFRPDHADVIQNCRLFRDVVAGRAMVDGEWGAEFHEGLGPLEGEFVVKHTRVNAFYGSPLEETLRVLGATRLVMAGIATNSVVETTARHAADIGYEVIVVADACSSGNPALHHAALENLKLLGEVETVAQVVARFA